MAKIHVLRNVEISGCNIHFHFLQHLPDNCNKSLDILQIIFYDSTREMFFEYKLVEIVSSYGRPRIQTSNILSFYKRNVLEYKLVQIV